MNKEEQIDYIEKRVHSKTQSFEKLLATVDRDNKTIIKEVGGINQHLKELNGKTDRTITKLAEEEKELNGIEKRVQGIETIFSFAKNFKWMFWVFSAYLMAFVISSLFGIPLNEVISLIGKIL